MSSLVALATQVSESSGGNAGETVLFWIIAPLAVVGALGLVFSRKAVHGALFLAVTMIGLAVLYIALEAPFLGVVQVVVYTGAIMMLFLFVIMLVGVDASDSRVETIRGQRVSAVVAVIGVVLLFTAIVGQAALPDPTGTEAATPDGNVVAIADLLFGRYVLVFEIVAALLITAAVGAMALTHRERIFHRPTQRQLSEQRFREGRPEDAAGLPVPGVYARHNAVDTPALLPDGTPSEASVSRVLVARGVARPAEEFSDDVVELADHGDGVIRTDADADAGSGDSSGHHETETGGERR
ncbi:MAG TPA: NADH-quinone oxidoreductase subunit J [Jiangellaceae bacterium]